MLKERLQVLISPEQRRRLEEEARRTGTSVGSIVREAIDARYGATTADHRREAVEGIAALRGRYLSPAELEAVVEEERSRAGGISPAA